MSLESLVLAGTGYRRVMRAAQIAELKSPPRAVEVDGPPVERSRSRRWRSTRSTSPSAAACSTAAIRRFRTCPAARRWAGRTSGALVYLFGEGHGIAKPGFLVERVECPTELTLAAPRGRRPGGCRRGGYRRRRRVGAGRLEGEGRARGPRARPRRDAARSGGSPCRRRSCSARRRSSAGRRAATDLASTRSADAFGDEGFTVCIDPRVGRADRAGARVWRHRTHGSCTSASRQARRRRCAPPTCAARSCDRQGHSNFAMAQRRARPRLSRAAGARRCGPDHDRRRAIPARRVAEAWSVSARARRHRSVPGPRKEHRRSSASGSAGAPRAGTAGDAGLVVIPCAGSA